MLHDFSCLPCASAAAVVAHSHTCVALLPNPTPIAQTGTIRGRLAYPLFDRSRPRNVCGRFGRAAALTEKNRSDSFNRHM
eukprot:4572956-Prymnesium_polylepis.2